jgi:Arm domain-containing DNA-binding protein
MLTDTTLRHLKPDAKRYQIADRDGMYALVSLQRSHFVSLRRPSKRVPRNIRDWRLRPPWPDLALAREKCMQARSAVERGESPAQTKRATAMSNDRVAPHAEAPSS